jgi:glycosyltransferase involved in cell wall biosynthesis
VRSYGFLSHLRQAHEVTLVTPCVSAREHADVEHLRSQGYEVISVEESKRQAMLRSVRVLLSSTPLQVAYARSVHLRQTVERLCCERSFDVIHVEHLRGIASLEQLASTHPLVWDAVDCISLLFKHTMVAGPSLPVRAIARLEYKRTHRYESRVLNKLPYVAVTSQRDCESLVDLKRLYQPDAQSSDEQPGQGICVIPNGVDLEYFYPTPEDERRPFNVVFSGKMSYHANVATALYLHQHIMRLIWKVRPEATLTIVGSSPPKAIQRLAVDPRVEVTGYVEDLRPYIRRAQVMLSPMVYSVGIQNKVLEAMALGTPVVVAGQAAASLEAEHGRELFVAGSPQQFADYALQLMNDEQLREQLSQHGRAYVEQHHNWGVLTERLVDLYRKAIASDTYASDALSHSRG